MKIVLIAITAALICAASGITACQMARANSAALAPRKIDIPDAKGIIGAPADLQQALTAMPELDKILVEVNESATKGDVEKSVFDSFGETERKTIEAYKARLKEKAQPINDKAQAVVNHLNGLRDKLRLHGITQGWFSAADAGRFEIARDPDTKKWQMVESPK